MTGPGINVALAAQEAAPAQGMDGSFFLMMGAIFAIFYFLLIAPMRKRQKATQAMIAALKKGDKVVTNGGLYGEIAAVQEELVILKLSDSVKVRVAKSAISGLEGSAEPGAKR